MKNLSNMDAVWAAHKITEAGTPCCYLVDDAGDTAMALEGYGSEWGDPQEAELEGYGYGYEWTNGISIFEAAYVDADDETEAGE